MAVKTIRNHSLDLTEHIVTQAVSLSELLEILEVFYEKEPTRLVLWDMSETTLSHVTAEDLRSLVGRAAELGHKRWGGRTAVIAPSDLQYGLGRMTQAFADLEPLPFQFQVFRSRDAAMAWLTSDRHGG